MTAAVEFLFVCANAKRADVRRVRRRRRRSDNGVRLCETARVYGVELVSAGNGCLSCAGGGEPRPAGEDDVSRDTAPTREHVTDIRRVHHRSGATCYCWDRGLSANSGTLPRLTTRESRASVRGRPIGPPRPRGIISRRLAGRMAVRCLPFRVYQVVRVNRFMTLAPVVHVGSSSLFFMIMTIITVCDNDIN